MKRSIKIASVLFSMLILSYGAVVYVHAAADVPSGHTCCCDNWQQFFESYRSGKGQQTDRQSLFGHGYLINRLKKFGGYCPDGHCITLEPSTGQTDQTANTVPSHTVMPDQQTKPNAAFRTAYEQEVVTLVNAERKKAGLEALKTDTGAAETAHIRAAEIVQSFSHTRPDGRTCFTAASDQGVSYRTAGENIAYGYASPEQVVNGWMSSEGHRKNILSASFTKIGAGCYEKDGVLYRTQFFIG